MNRLKEACEKREDKEKDYQESRLSNPSTYRARERFCKLEEELADYIRTIPVVGFNSQRYDLNILKGALVKCLEYADDGVAFVVKKTDALTCLQTSKLRFVDVKNFIAPGFSYSEYLDAFKVEQKKGFFPYEWLDSLEKLNHRSLPPPSAFKSSLKKTDISKRDYETEKSVDGL
jgi:hypothetical protein